MNEVRNKTSIVRFVQNIFVLFLLVGGYMFLFSACEREDDQIFTKPKPSTDGELVTVKFELNGMNFGGDGVSIRQGITPFIGPYSPEETSPYPLQRGTIPPSGEIEGSIESVSIPLEDNTIMYATLAEDDVPIMLRAAGPLNANANVRIYAYSGTPINTPAEVKQGYGDYVTSGGLSVNPLGPPLVVPSGTYRFVAYSFNNNNPLDSYAIYPDTTANITSRDVLWGDTLETVGSSSSTVQIRTHHKFSQVKIYATVDVSAGTRIDNISGVTVSHVLSRLVVKSGNLHIDNPAPVTAPVTWPNTGSGSSWTSDPMQIFTNGGPPTVQIGSVTLFNGITTTTYNAGYTIPFTTPLEPGKEYTLNLRFTKCTDLAVVMIASSGSTSTRVNTNAAPISVVHIAPSGATGFGYQWQRSIDGGTTWDDVAGETSNSLNPTAFIEGITKYRVMVSNSCSATLVFSNVIDITGIGPEPFDNAMKTFVGAFWKWNQRGERLIRVVGAPAYYGAWTATVIVGNTWIVLDNVMTSDVNVGWRTDVTPPPNESIVHNGNDVNFETQHPVNSTATTVSGIMDASNNVIYFRIGLTSSAPSSTVPRYGVVFLTFKNHSLSQRIFIRQGEAADFAPGQTSGVRWSPYNVGNINDAGKYPNKVVAYPSQAGFFYQWIYNSSSGPQYGFHPINPDAASSTPPYMIPNWVAPGGGNATAASNSALCPSGSPNFKLPVGSPNANFGATYPNDLTRLVDNAKSVWGYYADGFFDRRALITTGFGSGGGNVAGRAVSVNTSNASDPKNEYVAYAGSLIYNATDNKSIFFPSAGSRIGNNGGNLSNQGHWATYWSATPNLDPMYSNTVFYWRVWGAGVAHDQGWVGENYGHNVRCVQNQLF